MKWRMRPIPRSPAEAAWFRSAAAKKGWATRHFRQFEDPQLPLPMKSGVRQSAGTERA
jgi:hypothetical protein